MGTMIKLKDKLIVYEKALSRLHQIIKRDPLLDDIVVDAGIQRFEFTYELGWRLLKSILEYNGILEETSPRPTIKAAFREGLIVDGMSWLNMLEDRSQVAHTYDEQTAQDIFDHIRNDYIQLFDQLAVRVNEVLEEVVV